MATNQTHVEVSLLTQARGRGISAEEVTQPHFLHCGCVIATVYDREGDRHGAWLGCATHPKPHQYQCHDCDEISQDVEPTKQDPMINLCPGCLKVRLNPVVYHDFH